MDVADHGDGLGEVLVTAPPVVHEVEVAEPEPLRDLCGTDQVVDVHVAAHAAA